MDNSALANAPRMPEVQRCAPILSLASAGHARGYEGDKAAAISGATGPSQGSRRAGGASRSNRLRHGRRACVGQDGCADVHVPEQTCAWAQIYMAISRGAAGLSHSLRRLKLDAPGKMCTVPPRETCATIPSSIRHKCRMYSLLSYPTPQGSHKSTDTMPATPTAPGNAVATLAHTDSA